MQSRKSKKNAKSKRCSYIFLIFSVNQDQFVCMEKEIVICEFVCDSNSFSFNFLDSIFGDRIFDVTLFDVGL